MKALDKSYLLITVHLSVLVTIDLVDLNFFQTRGFKFEKKDISKPELALYQQYQVKHILFLSLIRLLNVQF